MPKMKTRKSVAKRYFVSSSGKVRRCKCGRRHLLEHKTSKIKRTSKGLVEIFPSLVRKVKFMIPYV